MTTKQRAAILRNLGYHVSYGTREGSRRAVSQKKAAVSRQWNKLRGFLNGSTGKPKNHVYVPARESQRATVSKRQRTPKGVFIPVPAGVDPKKFTACFRGRDLVTTVRDRASGVDREDVTIPLDPSQLAAGPKAYVDRLLKEYQKKYPGRYNMLVTVKGYDGKRAFALNLASTYITKLLGQIMAKGVSRDAFADIYQLKLVSKTADRSREFTDREGYKFEDDDDDESEIDPD